MRGAAGAQQRPRRRPARRGGGGWGKKPKVLKALGANKEAGTEISLRAGRYGPYVTDGEINASVPKGMDAEKLTLEEAIELIRKRAEKAPAGKKKTKKKAKKKTKKKPAKKAEVEFSTDETPATPEGTPAAETPDAPPSEDPPPLPF